MMKERGLTRSRRHWSRVWLGRAENYACLVEDQLSVEVSMKLACRLVEAGHRDLANIVLTELFRKISNGRLDARVAA
jgi:hypothetical protein